MTAAALALDADVSPWHPWSPHEVAVALEEVEAPWYVAGGWAIDLFLGEHRRQHDDLEIAVPAARFGEVARALAGMDLFVVAESRLTPLDDAGDLLSRTHQTWVREAETGWWRLDVFREPSDGDEWIFRRDPRIRLPYRDAIERTASGVPYGRPEIVLLFKASRGQDKKHADDFTAALPALEPERRRWLADALSLVHPGHPWLEELEAGSS
jgi:hypothetical protein